MRADRRPFGLRRDTTAEFESLVQAASPQLLRSVFLICRDLGRTEDVLQETWLRLAARWPRVRRMTNPAGYAYRIAINLAVQECRRTSRHRQLPLDDLEIPAQDAGFAAVEDLDQLRTALATLTSRQRAVLVLRHYEGRSEADVAGLLNCSIGTVKSTASRALDSLRASLATTPETLR